MKNNRLLIIDDEVGIRGFVTDVAEGLGFKAVSVDGFSSFQQSFRSLNPTHVILDLMMPEIDGVEVLRFLADENCKAAIIIMSGLDSKVLSTAQKLGTDRGLNMLDALQKPIQLTDLETLLQQSTVKNHTISSAELEDALATNALTVFYQPKIVFADDDSQPIKSAEALVRWQHPVRGLVPPNDFIPFAESCGLIGKITDFVIKATLDQIKEWEKKGFDIAISINIAPQTLTDLKFPDNLSKSIAAASIPAERITLEITESGAMGDDLITADILTRFRVKGVGLSLDDFGTGYSSMVKLYRMPFTEMKIDQSFVFDMEKSTEARAIIKAIIDLAHNLNLSVCAEGAETQAAIDYLRDQGCDMIQGYAISRPLPADEFEDFVREWNSK